MSHSHSGTNRPIACQYLCGRHCGSRWLPTWPLCKVP